ncbi:MAG: phosphoglycerate dehydrogenase [Spirochaetes bacterium]|jgi:D-3-phosphoglycerate dehydrogenase|nr:phosphoglycerate dehydrogenase [Spirochaetota bacterium]
MYKIQTLNKIAVKGLDRMTHDNYEIASEMSSPDGIIVRSFKMNDMELPDNLKAIARAGAGVNNIPVEKCTEKGVVVFNTPGANANSVKELVFTGMLMSARKIKDALEWVPSLEGKGDEVPKLVEKGKSQFTGTEISGKKIGIIGLGAIGVMVANTANALGMKVVGFDPFITVDNAWDLHHSIARCRSIDELTAECDYISLHIPLNDNTRGLMNKDRFKMMRKNTVLLNFARGGLVNNADLRVALDEGKVALYVTDFPDEELISMKNVINLPHLGASTEEAEENCAVMAVEQMKEYLENGTITNSINFPECNLPFTTDHRLVIANRNIPNMVGQISSIIAVDDINIQDMVNKHKNELAYNIINIDGEISDSTLEKIKNIDGVLMARFFKKAVTDV